MTAPKRISRDDLDAAFRRVQGGVEDSVEAQKKKVITGIVVTAAVILLVAYLLGRRGGRKKTTIVEIRRV
ncbi:MAG TPA: hypothetical protein VF855_02005 [Acidimicrobiales bacterium]